MTSVPNLRIRHLECKAWTQHRQRSALRTKAVGNEHLTTMDVGRSLTRRLSTVFRPVSYTHLDVYKRQK